MSRSRKETEKKIATRMDGFNKRPKPIPVRPVKPVKPIALPGQAPSYEFDGWWLQVPQAQLNMMCSPDGSSTWDMTNGGCTDPNY